ncbi:U32 family peptidase [Oscillospiraceae bacterium OttesenSCG-928-G22]|nr:U32 family peptidase [Oscillospiraceae bacterium OttesenSCG-928-G22]
MPIELLAPAGSPEGVRAAVQNGAGAVYLGLSDFNARRNAKNFTYEEFDEAVAYCHVRGAKVYVTLNTLATDRELPAAAEHVRKICASGADGVLVQDLGVLHMIRQVAPSLPCHASTQMSIHNLEGAKMAASLGLTRVVLARELCRDEIAYITKHSPIETEVFVHGALCMGYSGQCYLSAAIGERSGNRGLCAGPCRLPYGFGARVSSEYPLSLKDLSLGGVLTELREIGVASLKIEGRMKRPEYAALVTRIFAEAIREDRNVTSAEGKALARLFSRQGFTDGYYRANLGPHMFGVRGETPPGENDKLYSDIRQSYAGAAETPRVDVRFYCLVRKGQPALLAAEDDEGHTVTVDGATPELSFHRDLLEAEVRTQLYKTGGTPFACVGAKVRVDPGLSLPLSAINAMRREALTRLTAERQALPERETGEFKPGVKYLNRSDAPKVIVEIRRAKQITAELSALSPDYLYVPLTEIFEQPERITPFLGSSITVAAVLPRVILDRDLGEVHGMLEAAYALGVREAVAGNIGHVDLLTSMGFLVRGDFGLNVTNSQALKELKRMGLQSATLSPELTFPQIRDISKNLDSELIVYGRLPLMVTENCVIKNHFGRCDCENNLELVDRRSVYFPVVREYKCRNVILNSKKIFLADKAADYMKVGLSAIRLLFTTENPRECIQVTERYLGRGKYAPGDFTRGLYYRGVD